MPNFKNATIWTGKTYEIREALKTFGGKWDDAAKAWTLPAADGRSERMAMEKLYLKTDGVYVTEVSTVEP